MPTSDAAPGRREHGPLPAFLILLTGITGLIDAVSYLEFGNVFVANATGNVIFLGFRLGGRGEATGAFVATTISTVFFCVGAAVGGRVRFGGLDHRGLLLAAGVTVQAAALAVAALITTVLGHTPALERQALIPLLAASMGWQFAIVRRVDVPGLRTIVITTALTSLVADRGGPVKQVVGKALSIVALLVGAMAGALLIRHLGVAAPLWTAAAVLLGIGALGTSRARGPGSERWA
ncbi:YoaK family protein [Actinomadura rifamycini]|uniref:YoaK family protein n=1 Tax=Actinomadura rifamycini TaxID=31962 RepID=UPI0003FDEA9C|nr:YoaK family protein [Actinomadura rifamycini]